MSIDAALLVLRLVVGLLFVGHGAQKLFGWFKGPGLGGTAGWLGSLNLHPPKFLAALAGLSELGGGALLALGFLNPLGPLGIIASMLVAIAVVHWPKLWVTENGLEYPLVNLVVAALIGLVGPGRYSLDAALGSELPMPVTFIVGVLLVLAAVGGMLAGRTKRAPADAR